MPTTRSHSKKVVASTSTANPSDPSAETVTPSTPANDEVPNRAQSTMKQSTWSQDYYGFLGRQELFHDKLGFTSAQFNRYEELCEMCCKLYIPNNGSATTDSARNITNALHEHILGPYYDTMLSSKLEDNIIDEFYHATIFNFKANSVQEYRVGGPLPLPDRRMTLTQLRKLVSDEHFASGSINVKVESDVAMDSGEDEKPSNDQLLRETASMESATQAAIPETSPNMFPCWDSTKVELHIIDADGDEIELERPCYIPIAKLMQLRPGEAYDGDARIDPTRLLYGLLQAAWASEAARVGASNNNCDFHAIELRALVLGRPDQYVQVQSDDTLAKAYLAFQDVCNYHCHDNTKWPIFVRPAA